MQKRNATSLCPNLEHAFTIALNSLASSSLLKNFIKKISPIISSAFGFRSMIDVTRRFISSSVISIRLLYWPLEFSMPASLNNSITPEGLPVMPGKYGFEQYSNARFIGLVEG